MFLEHVNLTVSNLERSVDFYRQLLDFQVRWEGTIDSGQPAAHVGDDRCYLALFEATKPGHVGQDYGAVGLNHFGVVVDNLDECRQRLAELGVTPTAEADYEPGRRLYFLDPDGIEVELVEYDEKT